MLTRWFEDSRAVSTTLGYTLTLTITALLISGLFFGSGNFVENERDRAIRSQMDVLGQRLAANIEGADRLVRSGSGDITVRASSSLPERINGLDYDLEIVDTTGGDRYRLDLTTEGAGINVSVTFMSRTDVVETSLDGGDMVVVYDSGADQLEVRRDA